LEQISGVHQKNHRLKIHPMHSFSKAGLFVFLFCLCFSSTKGQSKLVEITHYLFPEFKRGVVLMKSAEKHEAMLNYNSLTEEMIFDNKGSKLAMADLDQVDTVAIEGRKFFLVNGKFVEQVFHGEFDLLAENKCKLVDPGKPSGYGGTTQTSATENYSRYFTGAQVYEMKLPEGNEIKPYIVYWLQRDGKQTQFFTIRQLAKLIPEKEGLLKEFTKKHPVRYENQGSMVGLMRYLSDN
jgi:hypothetical protein